MRSWQHAPSPTIPMGGTAVTVSGRRRRCPDVTPAGALTQVLGWPLASPRVSTARHNLLSAECLTGELARCGSMDPWAESYCRVKKLPCGLQITKEHPHEGVGSSDPKPFQLVTPWNKAVSLCSPSSQAEHVNSQLQSIFLFNLFCLYDLKRWNYPITCKKKAKIRAKSGEKAA